MQHRDNQDRFLSPNSHLSPDGSLASMKQTQTREAGSEVSRGSAYSNEAPHKSTEARCAPLPSTTRTISLGSDTSITLASLRCCLSVGTSCTDPVRSSTDEDSSCHLRNIENASSDEIIFFRSVRAFGLEIALCLASRCPLRLLHEIHEVNKESYAAALSELSLSGAHQARGESSRSHFRTMKLIS